MTFCGISAVSLLDAFTGRTEIEGLRSQLAALSSTELLRFGTAAKYRCEEMQFEDSCQLEEIMKGLKEARAEWNRRHPNLPLCDSF